MSNGNDIRKHPSEPVAANDDFVESARRALALKMSAPTPERPETRTSGEGMKPLPSEKHEPQGAIGAAGAKSAEEKGR